MLTGLPNPHSSSAPIAPVRVSDVRQDAWAYRLLRSLQVNRSSDRLVHRPYYRPFSAVDQGFTYPPFLVSADHYFEWRDSSHQYPIFTVNFCINPLFQFQSPCTILTNHLLFGCPCYQILWWDCPQHLPVALAELLFLQEEELEENSVGFLHFLEEFCQAYFAPIAPYPPIFNYTLVPDQPPSPPTIPDSPPFALHNPNTIPLVSQQ